MLIVIVVIGKVDSVASIAVTQRESPLVLVLVTSKVRSR